MLSKPFEMANFIQSIEGMDRLDIIGLADGEATRAERCCFRMGSSGSNTGRCAEAYAKQLKGLIFYLRYRAKPPGTDPESFDLMRSIRLTAGHW